MKRTLLATAIFASLLTAGCIDVSGGGWIESSVGAPAKATFGFQFDCTLAPPSAEGHITYHDHGLLANTFGVGTDKTKFAVNGVVTRAEGLCGPYPAGSIFSAVYTGTYTPIPSNLGSGGSMLVTVYDGGLPGPDKDDWLQIELTGGVYDGYSWGGDLKGGNITFNN